MSAPPGDSCVQACPNCGTLVDISEQEPLAKFDCPNCGTAKRPHHVCGNCGYYDGRVVIRDPNATVAS